MSKNWLNDTLGPLNFLTAVRERYSVRRTCNDLMKLYRESERSHPTANSMERYASIVAERTGGDQREVDRVLQRVEESFATWPVERPIRFRDVVQYFAITQYFDEHPSESGIRARVSSVVMELVPENI